MDEEYFTPPESNENYRPRPSLQSTRRSDETIHIMLGEDARPMLKEADRDKPLPLAPKDPRYPPGVYVPFPSIESVMEQTIAPGMEHTMERSGSPGPTTVMQREYELARNIEQRGQDWASGHRRQLVRFLDDDGRQERLENYQAGLRSQNTHSSPDGDVDDSATESQIDGNVDDQPSRDAAESLTENLIADARAAPWSSRRRWKHAFLSIFDCNCKCTKKTPVEGDLEAGNSNSNQPTSHDMPDSSPVRYLPTEGPKGRFLTWLDDKMDKIIETIHRWKHGPPAAVQDLEGGNDGNGNHLDEILDEGDHADLQSSNFYMTGAQGPHSESTLISDELSRSWAELFRGAYHDTMARYHDCMARIVDANMFRHCGEGTGSDTSSEEYVLVLGLCF